MQFGEPEHLLLHFGAAVLNNSLHLFMHELDAAQGRVFQATDLTFNEQFKRNFGDEKSRSRARCIANGGEDIQGGQAGKRMNRVQRPSESFMEDVAYPCASATVSHKTIYKIMKRKKLYVKQLVTVQSFQYSWPFLQWSSSTRTRIL